MRNFLRNVECKGLRQGCVGKEKYRLKECLEKETGVNIDYWYKQELVEKKRKKETELNDSMILRRKRK